MSTHDSHMKLLHGWTAVSTLFQTKIPPPPSPAAASAAAAAAAAALLPAGPVKRRKLICLHTAPQVVAVLPS